MGYKLKSAKSPDDLTERRKELIFVDGYDLTDGVTAFTATPNVNETNLAVFGRDSNITGTNVTSSAVSITVLEPDEGIAGFVRLIHNDKPVNDPEADPTQYRAKDVDPTNLLVMRKNNSDDDVIASRFIPGLTVSPSYPDGAPDDKSTRPFTGTGGTCREFDGVVTCDLVQSGETLRSSPFAVPREADDVYAVHIEMIKVPSGGTIGSPGLLREPIYEPGSAMVDSTGTVTWSELTDAVSLSDPGYAHIYYLLSGTTGLPSTNSTIQPEGMRGEV